MMDYSLLLGVHYPARHFTRASLEAGPSFSLDGTLPHVSPQPGGTLPGAGLQQPWRHSGGTGAACGCILCVWWWWGGILWVDGPWPRGRVSSVQFSPRQGLLTPWYCSVCWPVGC